jgi:hypothetical protein
MTTLANSDLTCLAEGTRFLVRRPSNVLILGVLGMGLSVLAPWIQLRSGLPDDLITASALICAAVVPLELYFIPRFLMAVDAEAGGNPLNAAGDWKVRFEERWLRAFLSKALLGLAVGIGMSFLLLPGLLVLLAFGWVPLRVLLKGEPLLVAAKGSLRMMTLHWRRTVLTTSAMAVVYLLAALSVAFAVAHFIPEPTLAQRITHPALWIANFLSSLLSLWLSSCFLALFRRLEAA